MSGNNMTSLNGTASPVPSMPPQASTPVVPIASETAGSSAEGPVVNGSISGGTPSGADNMT